MVAKEVGVDPALWKSVLARRTIVTPTGSPSGQTEVVVDEWETWCDPGMVVWRYGPWEFDDGEFDPVKLPRRE
jgi:hypothetical protein